MGDSVWIPWVVDMEDLPDLIETAEALLHVVIEDVYWLLIRVSKDKSESETTKRHTEYGEHIRTLKALMDRINLLVEGNHLKGDSSMETEEIKLLRERREALVTEVKKKNQTIKGLIDRLRQLQAGMVTLKAIE